MGATPDLKGVFFRLARLFYTREDDNLFINQLTGN